MFFINSLSEGDLDMTEYWKGICRKLDYAYQPIVNSYTGEVFAYEALLRNWKSAGFNTLFEVFDKAFYDKTLYTVDLELRKMAIEKIMQLQCMNDKALFYNLDNRVLEMPDYSRGNTLEMLNSFGINKSSFYFEISERHELNSYTDTIEILNQYKEENVKIVIDDYGSGYSGLQLLYHSEPDIVKIDRFFIKDIHKDQKKKLFAENIVSMSHIMGIKVVAEGIETDQELNFCREIGCDYLQGYRIAHPQQDLNELKCSYNLDEFTECYGRRKGEKHTELIAEHLTSIQAVHAGEGESEILKRFQKNSGITILPFINAQQEPLGVIREKDLKQYVYSPFGISLFKNHSHSRGLESFISRIPMVEISSSLEKILDISATFNRNEGIIITRNGKYLGVLEPVNIIKLIYEQKLVHAREQNPLSGLPGNFSIHKKLAEILAFKNRTKSRVIFFDFNNFKPFNDSYGFRMGDRLIILFTEILKNTFNFEKDFIAHVGGDDFIVIQADPEKDSLCSQAKKAQIEFESGARSYYSSEHREQNYMQAKNRKGKKECFALMTVSAAVLDIIHPGNTSLDKLNKIIFNLKKESKHQSDHFARKSMDYSQAPS